MAEMTKEEKFLFHLNKLIEYCWDEQKDLSQMSEEYHEIARKHLSDEEIEILGDCLDEENIRVAGKLAEKEPEKADHVFFRIAYMARFAEKIKDKGEILPLLETASSSEPRSSVLINIRIMDSNEE